MKPIVCTGQMLDSAKETVDELIDAFDGGLASV